MDKLQFAEQFIKIVQPIEPLLLNQTTGLVKIGSSGTIYNEKIRQAETFLRLLWGYAGYYKEQPIDALFKQLILGIAEGVNPKGNNYWGDVDGVNQLMVEMAPLAVFVLMNEEKVKTEMCIEDQKNMISWLDQINLYQTADNNWRFFRILVNCCLDNCYGLDRQNQIEIDFQRIDSFYLGNGWYYDGVPQQIDYYISFAIQYYSLLYVYFYKEKDSERCEKLLKRAKKFAQTFRYWFDTEGRGIPFGRSLTYRFAQASFWSAYLLVQVDQDFLAEAKWILKNNLRHWLQRDIFSKEGFLKIGYYYENLVMAEEYNGPGSPYWGLKSFILLALPKSHNLWEMQESIPMPKQQHLLAEAQMILTSNQNGKEVRCYPTGQYVETHTHGEAKYSKFVYSTNFGFNVSKGLIGWEKGGFDNVLAVSEDDQFYRVRTKSDSFSLAENYIYTKWKPWSDVIIESFIIPFEEWHFRIHKIKSNRNLTITDGGFSVLWDGEKSVSRKANETSLNVCSAIGMSGVISLDDKMSAHLSQRLSNQNLLYNCVVFPYLKAKISAGEEQLFVNGFVGSFEKSLEVVKPEIIIAEQKVIIKQSGNIIEIDVKEL
ncbi:hypothetical protein M2139_000959 [Enterococcus sp. PF1-24]|uniref:DUF2264 domain-containing protein n=1 Tax=unclassified Enterococcus TaxID=2608891 RepID=UPI00247491D8|nr:MULTISPECIES: DUF2264 domain-containing protein [unclassified Enterococcus]MDH6363974.1 hypothetical protein [Enterococcus sp. PFB1-1]MDH6401075.1 hypothetical protein [Enterococcus sp. PF1-24]